MDFHKLTPKGDEWSLGDHGAQFEKPTWRTWSLTLLQDLYMMGMGWGSEQDCLLV